MSMCVSALPHDVRQPRGVEKAAAQEDVSSYSGHRVFVVQGTHSHLSLTSIMWSDVSLCCVCMRVVVLPPLTLAAHLAHQNLVRPNLAARDLKPHDLRSGALRRPPPRQRHRPRRQPRMPSSPPPVGVRRPAVLPTPHRRPILATAGTTRSFTAFDDSSSSFPPPAP